MSKKKKRKGLKEYKLFPILKKFFGQKMTVKKLRKNIILNSIYTVMISVLSIIIYSIKNEPLILIIPYFMITIFFSVIFIDFIKLLEENKKVFAH